MTFLFSRVCLLKTDNTSVTTANKADLQEVLEQDYDTGTNEVSYVHSLTVIICFTKVNALLFLPQGGSWGGELPYEKVGDARRTF